MDTTKPINGILVVDTGLLAGQIGLANKAALRLRGRGRSVRDP